MNEKQKKQVLIAGSVVAVAIVLWFLLRNKTAGQVIVQEGESPAIQLPGNPPFIWNGSDPRLIYTPAEVSGLDLPLVIPDWPSYAVSTLPAINPTAVQGEGGCCESCDAGINTIFPSPGAWATAAPAPMPSTYLPFAWGY